ncbi:hypothetical protein COEREDRAFT_89619 [Coemansia reversa NRRL 1564]|uniref:G-protein coupled receptors family 3 profile domain-containing protein n=1 Tax=Coemansia reversa (strain ATCC 12441 / NRRL 1564) TaxID=763665 RepID=A0A2G5B3W1_COERN|nr:hypothetical protein COEREDRAFT_89619 [Coemansia reversa NRRL 1564]|eukprot:PIA13417.1 hypothetical protein COEREDRAFT_89619 [Coemansia reversa NRRL 1564]
MYLTFITMIMTLVGTASSASFSAPNKDLMTCTIAVGWMGVALGALSFVALLQLRVYGYINTFIWNRKPTGVYFIAPIIYIISMSILYAILSFVLPLNGGFVYNNITNTCVAQNVIYYIGLTFMIIQTVVLCLLLFKARTIDSCFWEFRKMLLVASVGILFGIIVLAIQHVHFGDDKVAVKGILVIIFTLLPQQVYFYTILGPPVYHLLRHREYYLHEFAAIVEEKGLAHIYELAGGCPLGEISDLSDSGKPYRTTAVNRLSNDSNFSGNEPAPEIGAPLPRNSNPRQSGPLLSYYKSLWNRASRNN